MTSTKLAGTKPTLPPCAPPLLTVVRAVRKDEIRTASDALAYLTECSLATVEHLSLLRKPPAKAYRSAVGLAQFGVDKCRELDTLGAGRTVHLLMSALSVDAWAGTMQRPLRLEPLGAPVIGEGVDGTADAVVFLTSAELDAVKALARQAGRGAYEYRRHIAIAQVGVSACCDILGLRPSAFGLPGASVEAWAKALEVPATKRARPSRAKAGQGLAA